MVWALVRLQPLLLSLDVQGHDRTRVGVTDLLGGVAHYWKSQQAQTALEGDRILRRRFEGLEQKIAETQGLIQLSGLNLPFPLAFGGDYALTADAAAVLARVVVLRRPKMVLELGSGVSTVLVARLLQSFGVGRIYSLEHEPMWAAETRKQVAAARLQDFSEVLDAPLIRQEVDGQQYNWYQLPFKLAEVGPIDLLIIDGPPQRIDPQGSPRYPAFPILLPQLSTAAEVFIDDAKRPAEQEMIRRWLARFPGWEAQTIQTGPGTCLLYRNLPAAAE